MPLRNPYTLASLAGDDPHFVDRAPGVPEIERLFPSPSSSGRGRLAVEGGVSVVAGPGMGKSSLLARLTRALDHDRGLATARVALPPAAGYPEQDGFYAVLGDLVRALRAGLAASPRIGDPAFAPVARVLATEPEWDAPGDAAASGAGRMTPRGLERWIASLGVAAVHTPGVCLLFDDVDHAASASWKNAFVGALRFTFQTSAGITPVYAVWTLFADEALAGSNYFRNVTRPVFLEPLSAQPAIDGGVSERRELVDLGLPALSDATATALFRLVGGHPQLLQRALSDVCAAVPDEAAVARLAPADLAGLFAARGADAAQRALARSLLARTPALAAALREIARGAPRAGLSKGVLATGLVDRDDAGNAVLPVRVGEVL